MKKILIGVAALVITAGLGAWHFSNSANAAPDVTFTSLTGERIATSDLRDKVVLVKFWATSCVTCVAQMPDLIDNYNALHERGFEVIAVAMQYDPGNYVKNFADTRKLPFRVALDSRGEIAKAFGDVKLTPTSFLIDKQGRIIKRYLGNYDKTAFLKTVNQALAG